jgi:carboxypeptidase C (cathepsin A)
MTDSTATRPPAIDANAAARQEVAVTRHVLAHPLGDLPYVATAGYLDLLVDDASEPLAGLPQVTARVFHTSYVADATPEERLRRPVIFVFNGGPGSSSVWLHLGLFGPRRVDNRVGIGQFPPPYGLVDNLETPLPYADVVVLDMVDTGYSRMVDDQPADLYHGVDEDVAAVTEIIRLWVTRNERWVSPIFIAGESYGVLRSSRVIDRLARYHGLYLRGLILISSPLGGNSMWFGPSAYLSTVAFLPTYAAVAHYHGLHPGRTLPEVVAEAEAYAAGPFLRVLSQGHFLPAAERAEAVATVACLTGLSPEFVDGVDLRISKQRFYTELLRSRGLVIGINDGRFTGWNPDRAGDQVEHDPGDQALRGAYGASINHYLRTELGYRNDLPYLIWSQRVFPWKPHHGDWTGNSDVVGELSSALRTNRHLKVLYHLGYYDTCTPYWGAVTDVAHLQIPSELVANIEITRFASGHMIYIDDANRVAEAADLERFVRSLTQAPATTPASNHSVT